MQLLQAGILPNPQVNFGGNYPCGGAIAGAVTASQVGLSWDVTELISRDARVRAGQGPGDFLRTKVAVPGGPAFENFELYSPFHEGQTFRFGVDAKHAR